MFINMLKSAAWFMLYFIASFVGTIIAVVAQLLLFGFEWPLESGDVDVWTNAIIEFVLQTAVPGLISASIICIVTFLIYKKINKEPLDIYKVEKGRAVFCVGLGLLLNAGITLFLALIDSIIPSSATDALESSTNIALTGNFFVVLLGTGILVPIMEEIVFRYGIHKTLAKSNVIVAYIISSLIFGIMHGNILQAIYAAVLGFVFAVVLTNTDNLWYPIIMHMTVNTSSTILTQFVDTVPEWIMMLGLAGIGIAIVVPFLGKESIKTMFVSKKESVVFENSDDYVN